MTFSLELLYNVQMSIKTNFKKLQLKDNKRGFLVTIKWINFRNYTTYLSVVSQTLFLKVEIANVASIDCSMHRYN